MTRISVRIPHIPRALNPHKVTTIITDSLSLIREPDTRHSNVLTSLHVFLDPLNHDIHPHVLTEHFTPALGALNLQHPTDLRVLLRLNPVVTAVREHIGDTPQLTVRPDIHMVVLDNQLIVERFSHADHNPVFA